MPRTNTTSSLGRSPLRRLSFGFLNLQHLRRPSSNMYGEKFNLPWQRSLYNGFSNNLWYFVISALVHPENTLLGFLTYSAVDALRCIELPRGEFLLVFHTLAVYVDSQGRKSRDREIMYPAVPTAVSELSLSKRRTVFSFLLSHECTRVSINVKCWWLI